MEALKQLLDFVLHLNSHLAAFVGDHGPWVYGLLFVIVFCETGLVFTPFLPGDSLLFATGAIAGTTGKIDPVLAGAVVFVAAVSGDTVNYWVGRLSGVRLSARFPRFVKPEYLAKTHDFFDRYGPKTIVLARFVPLIRTFAPFVAGIGQMPYRRFMMFNVIGAAVWVMLLIPAGYYFGQTEFVKKHFELVILGIIFISILPGVVEVIRERRRLKQGAQ
ncbi:MAG: DedA family protein [Pedosphaera sp.]|nr:DedA family protein [Pedosphaera sp.]